MTKPLLLLLLLLSACSSTAQIVYDFPEGVVKKIEDHISMKPDARYVIILGSRDSSRYSIEVSDGFYTVDSFKDVKETLVDKTSRFVKAGGKMIPLITWEDIYFADYGTVEYPESNNPKRRIGKKKIIFSSDAPQIVFDARGRIY